MKDVVFVADVHLEEGDEERHVFCQFLSSLAGNTRLCVIIGDLFNVWIAKRRFLTAGQSQLLDVLRQTAAKGVQFKYVEGNRDYFVAETWGGDPFTQVSTTTLTEQIGETRVLVAHGDLINLADRQYRLWRALSRSVMVRAFLFFLPARMGRKLANRLEGVLRGTNQRHKSYLPREQLHAYTLQARESGHDAVVLGHFHQEIQTPIGEATLWVLPDWKADRRYLRFDPQGRGRFVAFQSSGNRSRQGDLPQHQTTGSVER